MNFHLQADLDGECRRELERASVTGGQDNMPYQTNACIDADMLVLSRTIDESGNVQVPWRVGPSQQLMASTATLMEREAPYHLAVELARGKINDLRNQLAEWTLGGLLMPDTLASDIREATATFGHALRRLPNPDALTLADQALRMAQGAAHQLVQRYVNRVFELRHARQSKLDSVLACRVERELPRLETFRSAFNAVSVPFPWCEIEPEPRRFSWEKCDRIIDWALANGLKVIGGPLIDFSGRNLPDWIWDKTCDLASLTPVLTDYVDAVVRRYQSRIRTWQVSAGSNCAGVLASRDDELIWLTLRLAEAVRRINLHFEVVVGLAQPWGDYLAEQERSKTPFIFADDLLRTGIKIAALDLEFIMGVSPRGSYCRDLLDTSRLLDLYALLGVPLQATLAYPSSANGTAQSDPDQRVNLGSWTGGYTESAQADWASGFASLALCKPFVRTVQWSHWSDAEPHAYPNCGLVNAQGQEKPALQALTKLRGEHLK